MSQDGTLFELMLPFVGFELLNFAFVEKNGNRISYI